MPKVVFVDQAGRELEVDAPVGKTLLQIAHMHKIDVEGACDHSLACATCHMIIDQGWYDVLPEPGADEQDMLDLAQGLSKTSRLGCQIVMREEYNGLTIKLPKKTK